jgi:Asp-tRNA(Asn)/Glu-tRNA(Gln) amidotransferase A subunit family amidase
MTEKGHTPDELAKVAPMLGLPFAAKDIINSADFPTEFGSPIFFGNRVHNQPSKDAPCIAKLKAAGGILLVRAPYACIDLDRLWCVTLYGTNCDTAEHCSCCLCIACPRPFRKGKTDTTEFATSTANTSHNPYNLLHTPGGSSSGSAAAVADMQVPLAFGTQTNGSVIRPAAFCGVCGFKGISFPATWSINNN